MKCLLTKIFKFTVPFYGWGLTASRLESLRGGSLLFTTKFPKISELIFWTWERWKLSQPWSHPVVLNMRPLNCESSAWPARPLLQVYIYEHWNQDCHSKYRVMRQISFPGKRKKKIFRFNACVCFCSWVIKLLYFSLPLFFSLSAIDLEAGQKWTSNFMTSSTL